MGVQRLVGGWQVRCLAQVRPRWLQELQIAKSPDQSIEALLVAGAQERTRTSTVLPPPGPEPGASTNFATWALLKKAKL